MTTRTARARMLRALSVLLLAAATGVQAAPPARWTIEALGSIGDRGAFASGVNNRGQVVGYSSFSSSSTWSGFYNHGFVWENGTMADAGTPGSRPTQSSELVAINDHGLAVGQSDGYVYTYQEGSWAPLQVIGEPTDINKFGDVVGNLSSHRGFLYSNGVLHTVPDLGGGYSQAMAINDRGVVAGSAMLATFRSHAITYQNGVLTDLGTLGGDSSSASDINNHGVVVGRSATATSNQGVAFIYDGTMRPLLPGITTASYPVAINDRGAVVGTLDNGATAFLYEDGVLTRLEQLPEVVAAGWTRLRPTDINDRGWIVGIGTRNGANASFVLKPR